MTTDPPFLYRFGDIEVDPVRVLVRRRGVEQELRRQSFQVLQYLLEHRDRVVTKDELIEWVWKDTAVVDDALVQCISDVRRVVEDDPREPWFLRTIRRAGYRVIAPVTETPDLPVPDTPTVSKAPGRKQAARVVLSGAITVLIILTFVFMLRARTPASETHRGRVSVAIALFENLTKSPDVAWLENGLPEMLSTQLARDPRLTLAGSGDPGWLLERTGDDATATLQTSLAAAKRANTDRLISGRFSRVGSQVRIDVQLHDVRSGELVAGESLVVRLDELLTRVDGLALTLASRAAGTPPTGVPVAHLTEAMTANLDAYRLYSLGLAKARALHVKEAVTLFEHAVALDPEFAMAYARIGYTYGIISVEADRARPFLERARQSGARLTDKDRLQVEAWYAIANLDYPTAIQHYRLFINRYPTDIEGHIRLARLLSGEEQNEEAEEILRRALIIDPHSPDAYNLLGGIDSLLGKHAEAIAARSRYVELLSEEPNAYDSLGLSQQAAGAYDDAIRNYQRALQLDPKFTLAHAHLSNTYAQMGRYREAIEQLQKFLSVASGDVERNRGFSALSYLHRARGDLAAAERSGRQAAAELPEGSDALFLTLLEQGRVEEASAVRPWQNPRFSGRGGRLPLRHSHYVLGMEALARGRQKEALDLFRQALRYQRLIWFIDPLDTCLADAFLRLEMYAEAIREYDVALRVNPTHGMTHFRLARAYEGAGRPADARAEYRRFLELWNNADDDIPEVIVARRQMRPARPPNAE